VNARRGSAHLQGSLQQADLAPVRDAQRLERLVDLEAHPARVERVVRGDLGTLERERHRPSGKYKQVVSSA